MLPHPCIQESHRTMVESLAVHFGITAPLHSNPSRQLFLCVALFHLMSIQQKENLIVV